jgi:hypothetical protein
VASDISNVLLDKGRACAALLRDTERLARIFAPQDIIRNDIESSAREQTTLRQALDIATG